MDQRIRPPYMSNFAASPAEPGELPYWFRRCQNRGVTFLRDQLGGTLKPARAAVRHVGGAKLNQALERNYFAGGARLAVLKEPRVQLVRGLIRTKPMTDLGADARFFDSETRVEVMAGWRQAVELALSDEDIAALAAISRSRTEPASRVERDRGYRARRTMGVHHQTVQRCVERALAYGPMAALEDLPRPGKQPTITAEAKAWVVNLACRKAKELGYPHELWTTRLLARMCASMRRPQGTSALPTSLRALCATSSMSRR